MGGRRHAWGSLNDASSVIVVYDRESASTFSTTAQREYRLCIRSSSDRSLQEANGRDEIRKLDFKNVQTASRY